MRKLNYWSQSWYALVLGALVTFAPLAAAAETAQCEPTKTQNLKVVGETRLSVWFWDVYDAKLLTPSGRYENAEMRALRLRYLRDIKAEDLVKTTAKEWRKLRIEVTPEHEQWLTELRSMWPDVVDGDCIVLYENTEGGSEFYWNGEQLGVIPSPTFTQDFFAIWLSPNSRYQSERRELIGATQ